MECALISKLFSLFTIFIFLVSSGLEMKIKDREKIYD